MDPKTSLILNHQPIMRFLNYVEQLAMALTSQELHPYYQPNAISVIQRGFGKRGLDYLDITDKGAFIAGGFVCQCVYDAFWPDSDIDIYSMPDSILYKPYDKLLSDEERNQEYMPLIKTVAEKNTHQISYPDKTSINYRTTIHDKDQIEFSYQTNLLYSLISRELYFHRQISCKLWVGHSKWFNKSVNMDTDEHCSNNYHHYKCRLLYIRSVTNFRLDGRKNDESYLVQNILLSDLVSSIEQMIETFDLTICRLYFDGERIKFYRLNDFFKGRLLYRNHTQAECEGNPTYFDDRTLPRIKKYFERLGGIFLQPDSFPQRLLKILAMNKQRRGDEFRFHPKTLEYFSLNPKRYNSLNEEEIDISTQWLPENFEELKNSKMMITISDDIT